MEEGDHLPSAPSDSQRQVTARRRAIWMLYLCAGVLLIESCTSSRRCSFRRPTGSGRSTTPVLRVSDPHRRTGCGLRAPARDRLSSPTCGRAGTARARVGAATATRRPICRSCTRLSAQRFRRINFRRAHGPNRRLQFLEREAVQFVKRTQIITTAQSHVEFQGRKPRPTPRTPARHITVAMTETSHK